MSDLKELQQKIDEAREAMKDGAYDRALDRIDDALEMVQDFEIPERQRQEILAAIYSEQGIIKQRAGDPGGADLSFDQAETCVEAIQAEAANPQATLLLVSILINRSAAGGDADRRPQARRTLDQALALVESLPANNAAIDVLVLGILQNRATLEVDDGERDKAIGTLELAFSLGGKIAGTTPDLLGQLVTVAGRLAQLYADAKNPGEGVSVLGRASRWAEAAYTAGEKKALAPYVGAQMQLIGAQLAAGHFARAEDHFWRAMDLAPGPNVIFAGVHLYTDLLRRPAEDLQNGDLPREEVIDAFDEVIDRLKNMAPPPEVLEIVHARRAVLIDREIEGGDAVLSASRRSEQRLIHELSRGLAKDLEWARGEIGTVV